jgi:hypothetical protein
MSFLSSFSAVCVIRVFCLFEIRDLSKLMMLKSKSLIEG